MKQDHVNIRTKFLDGVTVRIGMWSMVLAAVALALSLFALRDIAEDHAATIAAAIEAQCPPAIEDEL